MTLKEFWQYLLMQHRGKTIGGLVGIAVGLLIVLLGWKILVLVLFAIIGLFIGKSIDDNLDPRDVIKRIFGS